MIDPGVLVSLPNLAQILILWVLVYWTLRYLETTIAGAFIRGIGFFALLAVIAAMGVFDAVGWATLSSIFRYFIIFAVISMVIIFQPELRHGLTRLSRSPMGRLLRRLGLKPEDAGESAVDEIVKAARRFSKNRVGSLAVIEREVSLQPYVDRAVRLDSLVKAEMLDTLFSTPTILHDGAVIIRGDRIAAAGVVLPLTQNPDIPKRYGTRHRAAIGISEESDAVVVVTSEETGAISLCVNGAIQEQEDTVKTEETLTRLLAGEAPQP